MDYLATYLIYLAVLARTWAWYRNHPPVPPLILVVLFLFGLVMLTEILLTRRFSWYPRLYLVLQSLLIVLLLVIAPKHDFFPDLFIPLSYQAVSFFQPRSGFLWIGAFSGAMAAPVMIGWNWQPAGLATVLLLTAAFFLTGKFAQLTRQAQQDRYKNEQLTQELEQANRTLRETTAQIEELAVGQERSHMARELHDSVTQTIFSMNLAVQTAGLLWIKEPERVVDQLDRIQTLAYAAVSEIQVLTDQLRPFSASEAGLASALQSLAAERQKRGLQVKVEVHGERQLPEPVSTGLYRITQEALNNVAKHSGVCEAQICLNMEAVPPYLEILDHGVGFDVEIRRARPGHVGLPGMHERALEIGWRLEIISQPGLGTRVIVEEGML